MIHGKVVGGSAGVQGDFYCNDVCLEKARQVNVRRAHYECGGYGWSDQYTNKGQMSQGCGRLGMIWAVTGMAKIGGVLLLVAMGGCGPNNAMV